MMQGFFRFSRLCLAAAPAGHSGPSKGIFKNMRFGNPFADDYPAWIWKGLKNSRKDKDVLAPFFRLLNATKLYDCVLKNNWSYWMFVVSGGMITSFVWSETWNKIWRSVNHGKLYNDVPYVYSEED
ncbi:ubiquinol-cytochrome c family reductase uqcrx qcr9-like protein [Cyclospora cayetanensis]|uniref:Ubiquinol-cytochrome c family reductase uqcrx qcr9-like protein n=1 Tax=Cyclospora cayetanensis TaxID=88456 RepID=A0A1D3CV98_9EIME|nr:ubiquinol-cytochrome c family reductase uqcrx qcr9-like protein [Cyclospora cayetanensis]